MNTTFSKAVFVSDREVFPTKFSFKPIDSSFVGDGYRIKCKEHWRGALYPRSGG
jgi:hypothetical protein